MKKKVFYSELAYVFAMLILSLGTALMARADFGVSMVVAPAYLLHLALNPVLPFFSFGMAEYLLQMIVLLLMMLILHRASLSYLFSFATAILYGLVLDGCMALAAVIPAAGMGMRIALYILGMALCCIGVSLFFKTYFPAAAYERFVKEVSEKTGMPIHRFKTIYDCTSCLIAIALSFIFFGFGHFEGVKLGTIICALVNGWGIGLCSRFLDSRFDFRDGLKLRKVFQ